MQEDLVDICDEAKEEVEAKEVKGKEEAKIKNQGQGQCGVLKQLLSKTLRMKFCMLRSKLFSAKAEVASS